jgi:hypothetical protein
MSLGLSAENMKELTHGIRMVMQGTRRALSHLYHDMQTLCLVVL